MTTKPDPAYAPPNVVTLLTAKGKRLTKTIAPDGTKLDSGDTKVEAFTHAADEVRDLDDFFELLCWLETRTDTCIVRPAVIEGAPAVIRRKSNPSADPKRPRCLIDIRRYWLSIDIDKSGVLFPPDWRSDPERHIRALIRKVLPKAFHDAGVIAQFSSQMRADGGNPRVHLWFWLSRPLLSIAAKRWLKGCKIDDKLYSKGQPHYTASPIFEDGVDPLGEQRLVFLPGPVVEVPEGIDTSEPEEVEVDLSVDLSGYVNLNYGDTSWKLWLSKIGDHEGGIGFHPAILNAAINYVRQNYNPQADDPVADLDYPKFEQAILDHVRTIKDLSPDRQADLDDRLRDMERCFWGAVPKVEEEIRKAGLLVAAFQTSSGPRMTLLEMFTRGKAAHDVAR